jgi:N6-adenosine-specific RNA methylase IME4
MSDGCTDAARDSAGALPFLALLDPPWTINAGGGGRGAQAHYRLTSVDGIATAVRMSGLWQESGPALVWMWATSSALLTGDAPPHPGRRRVRLCSGFVWLKVDVDDDGSIKPAGRLGLGQWSRCEHEHLLLCRRGEVAVPPPPSRCRSTIYAPRGRHSAKPAEAWEVVETTSRAVLGDVPGVEFFARSSRAGWSSWGNEAPAADEASW